MTPAQLYDGILKAMNDKEAIDLIERTKEEWENEGYREAIENYLNDPMIF